jgi:glycosyltransferase involved in cell wall biosynthesis
MLPLVTVYIPSHNRIYLLVRSLNSVIQQTYPNIQIVVVADSCRDRTLEVLKILALDIPYLDVYGVSYGSASKARNYAISKAKGEFITGLDDDDYLEPNHVEKLVESQQLNPSVPFWGFSAILHKKNAKTRLQYRSGLITTQSLLEQNIVGNQIFTRTSYLRDIGGFDEDMNGWEDYDLWLRMAIKYGQGKFSSQMTYHMDISHASPRITSSISNVLGAEQFYNKHSAMMRKPAKSLHILYIAYIKRLPFKLAYLSSIRSRYFCFAVKLNMLLLLRKVNNLRATWF